MKNTTKKAQKTYSHLSQNERDRIEILRSQGIKTKDIALALKRNRVTIEREIKRNRRVVKKGRNKIFGEYEANTAGQKAYVRRKYSKFQWKKINHNMTIQKYVVSRLVIGWSPSDIDDRSKKETGEHISKTAIYEWLRKDSRGKPYCSCLYSGRVKVKKRRKNKTIREIIPNRIGIEMRPKEAEKRTICGHCEADLIVSGRKTGTSSKAALSVIIDRKSKYLNLDKIARAKADNFNKSMEKAKKEREKIITLTLDNGKENSKWEKLGMKVYFCTPYHSWEKGAVENMNLWLRKYFKKGSDLSQYSKEYISYVESIFNFKPRKSLGGLTPFEVMLNENMLRHIKKESLWTYYLGNGILNSEYFKQQLAVLANNAKCALGG